MSIKDFFVPKWKHSDPKVRIKAIQNFDSNDSKLIEIIEKDDNEHVCVAALDKVDNIDVVIKNINSKKENIKNKAVEKLNIYINKNFNDDNLLKKITSNSKLNLKYIFSSIENEQFKLKMIDLLSFSMIIEILSESSGEQLGTYIIEHTDGISKLESISKKASNRKVRAKARDKIAELEQAAEEQRKLVERTDKLEKNCILLESLAQNESWETGRKTYQQVLNFWSTLDINYKHPLFDRVKAAWKIIEPHVLELEKERAVSEKSEEEMRNLCQEVERLIRDFPEGALAGLLDAEEKFAAIDAKVVDESSKQRLQARFEQGVNQLKQQLEDKAREFTRVEGRIQVLQRICDDLQQLTQYRGHPAGASKRFYQLGKEWKREFVFSDLTVNLNSKYKELSVQVEEHIKNIEQKLNDQEKEQEQELQKLLQNVQDAVVADNFYELEPHVRQYIRQWDNLGNVATERKQELQSQFEKACIAFFEKQSSAAEQREWQLWSNLQHKTQLCEEAEQQDMGDDFAGLAFYLRGVLNRWKNLGPVPRSDQEQIEQRFSDICLKTWQKCLQRKQEIFEQVREVFEQEEDWEPRAMAIRGLQKEWSSIGPLPEDMEKELVEQFYSTCNSFFEQRKQYYEQRNVERQENMQAKQKLCDQAAYLSESTDWNATSAELRRLQQDWKAIGPAPRGVETELWDKFQAACNSFFSRLEESKPVNLKLKIELCEQAEVLVNSDKNKSEIAESLKELQQKWKEIGPVPKENVEEIWKRFHKPCDDFFNSWKQAVAEHSERLQNNYQAQKELVEKAKQLQDSSDWKETAAQFKILQKKWKRTGPVPKNKSQDLWDEFRSAGDTFFHRRREYFKKVEQEQQEKLLAKQRLYNCLQVLSEQALDEVEALKDNSMSMAERLELTMHYRNQGLISGAPWRGFIQEVKRLQREWKNIGPLYSEKDKLLWERFRSLSNLFFQPKGKDKKNDNSDSAQSGLESAESNVQKAPVATEA